jgi:hypothetical protein
MRRSELAKLPLVIFVSVGTDRAQQALDCPRLLQASVISNNEIVFCANVVLCDTMKPAG